jgi:hypothetical protein
MLKNATCFFVHEPLLTSSHLVACFAFILSPSSFCDVAFDMMDPRAWQPLQKVFVDLLLLLLLFSSLLLATRIQNK